MKKILFLFLQLLLIFSVTAFFKLNLHADSTNEHYYLQGLCDGAVYKIKNTSTGLYMDLNNSSISSNTKIILNSSSNSDTQKFKISYYGNDRYVIEPYNHSELRIRMANNTNSTILSLYSSSLTASNQRFKINILDSNHYSIVTDNSSCTKALVAGWDYQIGDCVMQDSIADLGTIDLQWEFERVNNDYDNYKTCYIKDNTTGLYLSLLGGINNPDLGLTQFNGLENQLFKKYTFYEDNMTKHYYVPLKKTDVAVTLAENVYLSKFNKTNNQKFIDYDVNSGYLVYCSLDGTPRSIGLGDETQNGNNTIYHLKGFGYSEACYFEFYNVGFDSSSLIKEELNYTALFEMNNSKQVILFRTNEGGNYRILIKKLLGNPVLGIYNLDGTSVSTQVNVQDDLYEYLPNLSPFTYYYLEIQMQNITTTRFYLNIFKDLTVYIHGMNTKVRDGYNCYDCRTNCSIPAANQLNTFIFYDPIINTEADMNTTFIRNIDPTTGIVPLQAPVYIETGHGNSYRVEYSTGTSTSVGASTYLYATDLYDFDNNVPVIDLTNCKFMAFVACKTAEDYNENMALAAYLAGAEVTLGYREEINAQLSNELIVNLMEQIFLGKNLHDAIYDITPGNINYGLSSYKFYGNEYLVLESWPDDILSNR